MYNCIVIYCIILLFGVCLCCLCPNMCLRTKSSTMIILCFFGHGNDDNSMCLQNNSLLCFLCTLLLLLYFFSNCKTESCMCVLLKYFWITIFFLLNSWESKSSSITPAGLIWLWAISRATRGADRQVLYSEWNFLPEIRYPHHNLNLHLQMFNSNHLGKQSKANHSLALHFHDIQNFFLTMH